MRPHWLSRKQVLAIHAMQLSWFGGGTGLRDVALLDSSLADPRLIPPGPDGQPSLPVIAAAYAARILRNRPFNDGNQRTALVAAFAFLERNGLQVAATQRDAYKVFRDLAVGEISQNDLLAWLSINTKPVST
jgi:death-on-curing protein